MTPTTPRAVEAVLADLLARVDALGPTTVAVASALGGVAYEDIRSTTDLPRFDNAAMDGFAIRAADTSGAAEGHPVRLTRVGASFAGTPGQRPTVGAGQAATIATGAPVPPGADAVVRVERTTPHDDVVVVHTQVHRGADIRRRGEDLRVGDVVVPAGNTLGPGQIAALSGTGHRTVVVHRRPKVAVLLTGDEVAASAGPIGDVAVYDAVGPALAALLTDAGASVSVHGPVGDEEGALSGVLTGLASESDLVVTVGGISRGERDLLPGLVADHGAVAGRGVLLRPGAPFLHGRVGDTLVACLPGTPGAALVTATLFLVPLVAVQVGRDTTGGSPLVAVLQQPVAVDTDRWQWLRGVVVETAGGRQVRPVAASGPSMLHALAVANAWLLIAPGSESLAAGDEVPVVPTWGDHGRADWRPR